MSVQRILQRDVDTATAEENVFTAAERMHQRTVGALVVVNDDNVPVGIVTDRDIVVRLVAAGRDAYTSTVRDVMTASPKTVTADTPIDTALALMQDGAFRRLPIIDKHRHLVGIVTLDDILLLFSEEMSQIGRVLERETPQAAALPGSHAR
jgi:CBS domain-containing protein